MRQRWAMFDGLVGLSALLCAAAMGLATPDRGSTTQVLLVGSRDALAGELPVDVLSVRLIGDRKGHYLVESPLETYGQLFVTLPFGRVPLTAAACGFVALVAGWCAVVAYRRGRLRALVMGVSMALLLGLVVWRAWGPPVSYPDGAMFWSGPRRPPRGYWPMHQNYNLPIWGEEFPYPIALMLALIAPGCWCIGCLRAQWKLRKGRRVGHCSICGYDLRATPERCPECGTVPKHAAGDSTDLVEVKATG